MTPSENGRFRFCTLQGRIQQQIVTVHHFGVMRVAENGGDLVPFQAP